MATRFKPDEVVERQILAELYEATDQTEAAVGEHSLVLQKDPLRVDPYRSLYKLYLRDARVRPRVVHVRGARRSCARPTTKSSASSRTTGPRG